VRSSSADHLECTLVPAPQPESRHSGKATGSEAPVTERKVTFPEQRAPTLRQGASGYVDGSAGTAGWLSQDKPAANTGKRHVSGQTAHQIDLTQLAADGAEAAAGRPTLQGSMKSNARLPLFVGETPTPRQRPAFKRADSVRVRDDARGEYQRTLQRSTSSAIFADMQYPTGSA
jgi:hypothetical protein